MLESLFNKFAGLQASNFATKRLQHRCFPVNIAKFLKTIFLHNTSGRPVLIVVLICVALLPLVLSKKNYYYSFCRLDVVLRISFEECFFKTVIANFRDSGYPCIEATLRGVYRTQ